MKGERGGRAKACEAQIRNPNWAPNLAPLLWRRSCVSALGALSRQRGTRRGAKRSPGPKTHINTAPFATPRLAIPNRHGGRASSWMGPQINAGRHGGAWPLATDHGSGRPTQAIASARAAQIARDKSPYLYATCGMLSSYKYFPEVPNYFLDAFSRKETISKFDPRNSYENSDPASASATPNHLFLSEEVGWGAFLDLRSKKTQNPLRFLCFFDHGNPRRRSASL